jgi:hypothetical protein
MENIPDDPLPLVIGVSYKATTTSKFKLQPVFEVHWNAETFLNDRIALLSEVAHANPPSAH